MSFAPVRRPALTEPVGLHAAHLLPDFCQRLGTVVLPEIRFVEVKTTPKKGAYAQC